MRATVAELMNLLRLRGVEFAVTEDRVRVRGWNKLSADEREALRDQKDAVKKALLGPAPAPEPEPAASGPQPLPEKLYLAAGLSPLCGGWTSFARGGAYAKQVIDGEISFEQAQRDAKADEDAHATMIKNMVHSSAWRR